MEDTDIVCCCCNENIIMLELAVGETAQQYDAWQVPQHLSSKLSSE